MKICYIIIRNLERVKKTISKIADFKHNYKQGGNKMLRKITALLLTIAVCLPIVPVSAATGVPDLIITDIRISKPDYEVGDIVSFEMDIKNVGTRVMKLGYFSFPSLTGVEKIVRTYMWTRPRIFPGQTITVALDDFRVTNTNITVQGFCNSSGNTAETNRSNNYLTKSFTPVSSTKNLVIEDVRLSESNILDGNVATFDIVYKNAGGADIPQSDVEIKLTVGNQVYTVTETTAVLAKEKRTVTSQPVYVKGEDVTVVAKINPNNKISEDITTDNEKSYQYSALVSKATDYTWQPVRIGGGGWPRIGYVNEYIKDQVFQLTDVNGLYKYDEYTKTNTNIMKNIDLGSQEGIGSGYSLAIGCEQDPERPNIIYYAGGTRNSSEGLKNTAVMLRTDDGGKSWISMNPPFDYGVDLTFHNSIIDLDPKNSDVLYVSTAAGLWRTKNAKSASPTWEKLTLPGVLEVASNGNASDPKPSFTTTVSGVVVDKTSTVSNGLSQVIYAAVNNVGILKSSDGGATFALMSGSPNTSFRDIKIDSNGGLIIAGYKCVWSYTKSNNTWTNITPPEKVSTINANGIVCQATVHPNNPNLVAVTINTTICEEVYVSTDRGANWKAILTTRASGDHESEATYAGTMKNKIPWHSETAIDSSPSWVAFDPFNDGRLFVNAWFGAYQTLDYTASTVQWEDITWGIEESFTRSLLPMPEGAKYELLHGSNDFCGVAIEDPFEFSAVRFLPHTQETTGLAYMEKDPTFVVRNGGTGRGTGAGNGFYSTDGGTTWTAFPSYPIKTTGTERQQAGKIVVAADRNANGNPTIMMVMLGNDTTIPADSTHGRVWRSEDLGNSWTWVETLPINAIERFLNTCEPLAADRVNKNKFYFYDFRTGDVYRSTDNGKTFSVVGSLPAGDTESSIVSAPGKEGELYVNISYDGLWHSTDGGATWTKLTAVERARFFDLGKAAPCSPDNHTLYILGEVSGVYGIFRSTDLGQTWVRIDDPGQESLWNKLTLIKASKKEFGRVYVGTDGGGIIMGYLGGDRMQPRTAIYEPINGKRYKYNQKLSVTGGSTKPGTVYITVKPRYGSETTTTCTLDKENKFAADLTIGFSTNTITVYSIDNNGYKSLETTYTVTGSFS